MASVTSHFPSHSNGYLGQEMNYLMTFRSACLQSSVLYEKAESMSYTDLSILCYISRIF